MQKESTSLEKGSRISHDIVNMTTRCSDSFLGVYEHFCGKDVRRYLKNCEEKMKASLVDHHMDLESFIT